MVASRKRSRPQAEPEEPAPASTQDSLLQRVRNSWYLANIFQWIFLFGKVVKIDDSIDMEDLEAECLKPSSTVLSDIGLSLLKFVSSHRGLTPQLFDEYTRRQYVAKAPHKNPFGTQETPAKFHDFDPVVKLEVLQQLIRWVMLHPERIREKMDEQTPADQTEWRIEPIGWDSHDRTYFILDDNRIYRLTEAQPAAPVSKPKKNSQKAKAAARAAKRRRVSEAVEDAGENIDITGSGPDGTSEAQDDGLGGAKWECVGVNLPQVNALLQSMQKTRDENEKNLRAAIEEHLLPILQRQETSRQRKAERREKELASLEKMAFAKRSSRLASKAETTRQEEQIRQDEEKRRREEAASRKEEQRRAKMEKERDNRLMSREQRLQERQSRRTRHEKELSQLSGPNKSADGRLSGRRLKAEIEKNKRALEELEEEEDEWTFDCVCGVHGQVDDGNHSVACERCNVWQHSGCIGVSEEAAEKDDFHFVCEPCKRQLAKSEINVGTEADSEMADAQPSDVAAPDTQLVIEIPSKMTTKPDLSPQTVANPSGSSSSAQEGQPAPQPTIPVKPAQPSGGSNSPRPNGETLNSANPFLSQHPNLLPPDQSPTKSKAYSTLINSSPGAAMQKGERGQSPKGAFDASSAATSLPPHADTDVPSLTATSGSPLKQPFDSASRGPSALSPPAVSLSSVRRPSTGGHPQSPILSTPQLKQRNGSSGDTSPTLPPTQNGLSPLKRSPPSRRSSSFGQSTPAAAILPPVTALSPSPSRQIMTPPVKPTEPMRPASQQSSFAE